MPFDNSNDIEINVKLDARDARSELSQLKNETQGFTDSVDDTSFSLSSFTKGIGLVTAAVATATGAFIGLKSVVDFGDKFSDIQEGFENAATQAGILSDVLLNNLSAATKGAVTNLELMATASKALQLGIAADQLDDLALAAQRFADKTGGDAVQSLNQLIQAVNTGREAQLRLFGTVQDGVLILDKFTTAQGSAESATRSASDIIASMAATIENTLGSVAAFINDLTLLKLALAGAEEVLQDFIRGLGVLKEALASVVPSVSGLMEAFSNTPFIGGFLKQLAPTVAELEEASKVAAELTGWMNKVRTTSSGTSESVKILGKSADSTSESSSKLSTNLQKTNSQLSKLSKEAKDAAASLQTIKTPATLGGDDPAIDDLFKPQSFDLGSQIADELKVQFDGIADETASVIGDSLITAFQTGLDLLATAISGGQIDTGQLVSNLSSTVGTIIGASFGGPAGAQIGQIAGSFVGTVVNGLIEHFNSDTPGTTARKAADKFFADVFDANRLAIVVGDQLKQVTDLVFKGDTPFGGNADFASGGFDDFLTTLPANVQAGLKGVGAAFEELLGIGEDVAGQLAAVIANNIGGELNNLQLLVEATGKSFDELHNAVVEAFLDGKLSIEEAQIALEGLQQVSEAGIPGAIGDIAQAFRNLQASAATGKGSRALVDAIRDIGIEAQEVGVRDLPTLANRLINVFGFSAQQVSQFFEAMKASGINSIQELANASTEVAIATAANFQAIQEGREPTATPVVSAATSTPSSGGGFSGGGVSRGKSDAQQKAEQRRKQQEQERKKLIQEALKLSQASEAYRKIIDDLNAGLLTQQTASAKLNEIYADTHSLLKQLKDAQDKYNAALQKGNATSAQAKAVIELQTALDKLSEKAKKISESINLDFLKDFSNNLNIIGLAATELGISLEDTEEKIVNAFKAGKLSIAEANKELEKARDLLTAGIPGASGATKEAFENLLKGGVKGGAFSIDAFKDIFAEAQEKFLKGLSPARSQQFKDLTADFEGLKQALNDALSGGPQAGESRSDFDARIERLTKRFQGARKALDDFYETVPKIGLEDLRTILLQDIDPNLVQEFFTALSDSGLNSFDDLANASDSAILGILNKLGELSFPFQETSNEIQRVNDQLAAITQDKDVSIRFNVSTGFADDNASNVFNLLFGNAQGINSSVEITTGGLSASERVEFERLSNLRKKGKLSKDQRARFDILRRKARS